MNKRDLTIRPSIDFGYPTEAHGKIPAFNNIDEEAEFWDTHDFTDLSELVEESEPEDPISVSELGEDIHDRHQEARLGNSEDSPE